MVYKMLPLKHGLFAIIDPEDYYHLIQRKWRYNSRYVYSGEGNSRSLHREIMRLPQTDPRCVDHKNGNTLDNRKCNLRICTQSQNTCNRKPSPTRKYKGVYYDPRNSKKPWRVQIKNKYVGYYKTETKAALAYNKMAVLKFKEYAKLNVI